MNAIPVRDKAARDLLVKRFGLIVYRVDLDQHEMYDGNPDTGWITVKAEAK